MSKQNKLLLGGFGLCVLVFLAFCIAAVVHLSRFAPCDGVRNYSDFKEQGLPITKAVKLKQPENHICIIGDIDSVSWTIPSGPPGYHFDASGRLVDFTLDIGDSSKFQNDYLIYSAEEIPLDEIEAFFAINK